MGMNMVDGTDVVMLFHHVYDAGDICKDFQKIMAEIDAMECLSIKNAKIRQPTIKAVGLNSACMASKPFYFRRTLFCLSGHLPCRIRKKRKNR